MNIENKHIFYRHGSLRRLCRWFEWSFSIHCDCMIMILDITYGPLFTKRQDVLSQDIVKSRSREDRFKIFPVALKFDRHLGSNAAEIPLKFKRNTTIITSNLAVSRLHEIWLSCRWLPQGDEIARDCSFALIFAVCVNEYIPYSSSNFINVACNHILYNEFIETKKNDHHAAKDEFCHYAIPMCPIFRIFDNINAAPVA